MTLKETYRRIKILNQQQHRFETWLKRGHLCGMTPHFISLMIESRKERKSELYTALDREYLTKYHLTFNK